MNSDILNEKFESGLGTDSSGYVGTGDAYGSGWRSGVEYLNERGFNKDMDHDMHALDFGDQSTPHSGTNSGVSSEMTALTKDMYVVASGRGSTSARAGLGARGLGKCDYSRSYPMEEVRRCQQLEERLLKANSRPMSALRKTLLRATQPDTSKKVADLKNEVLELHAKVRMLDSELRVSREEVRSGLRANAHLRNSNAQLTSECESANEQMASLRERLKTLRLDKIKKSDHHREDPAKQRETAGLLSEIKILRDSVRTNELAREKLEVSISTLNSEKADLVHQLAQMSAERDEQTLREMRLCNEFRVSEDGLRSTRRELEESKATQRSDTVVSALLTQLERARREDLLAHKQMVEMSGKQDGLKRRLMLALVRGKQLKAESQQLKSENTRLLAEVEARGRDTRIVENSHVVYLRKIRGLNETVAELEGRILSLQKRELKRAPVKLEQPKTTGGLWSEDRRRPPPIETNIPSETGGHEQLGRPSNVDQSRSTASQLDRPSNVDQSGSTASQLDRPRPQCRPKYMPGLVDSFDPDPILLTVAKN